MNDSLFEIVRRAVAAYIDRGPARIRPGHRFDHDLALYPLDIALIMLDIEEEEGIELPIDRLDSVETVADLANLVRRAVAIDEQDAEHRALAAERGRRPSGTLRKVTVGNASHTRDSELPRAPSFRTGGQGR